MSTPEQRLTALGVTLPDPPAAAGAYVPWTRSGALVHVSGQLPLEGGELVNAGRLGEALAVEDGQACARACAVNVLAHLQAAAGELDRVARLLKISVYVASTPEFGEQHLVANGASELLAEALGEAGVHARAAVGVAALPKGAPVEVDAVAELAD